MLNWKLILEYEGTRYAGWQQQANAKTVSGELIKAAEQYFNRNVEIMGSGRTDAGVHAISQVAHLKLSPRGGRPKYIPKPHEINIGINDLLPADINILNVSVADDRFHARHDASSRTYLYQISTRRTALAKKFVWWIKDNLDVNAMRSASELISGRHDFAAFSERDVKRPGQSTIVDIHSTEIDVDEYMILFRISASHFLWRLVRRIVGSLVEVGRGNATPDDIAKLLADPTVKTRLDPARVTAPPSGLFLESVEY